MNAITLFEDEDDDEYEDLRDVGRARLQNLYGCWLIFSRRLPVSNSLRSMAEPGLCVANRLGLFFL